jgi:hypothetical protein
MERESVITQEWSRRGRPDVTRKVSPTKVEFKPGVQPQQPSGLHDISHSFESTGRSGDAKSFGSSDRVLELASDLLSLRYKENIVGMS